MKRVSAYIPCFNNSQTVGAAIASIKDQTIPVDQLIVVDDGSTDDTVEICRSLGVKVHRFQNNRGRGAARHAAMCQAKEDIVLSCDATNKLSPDFVERAMPWFEDARVAAVFGRISQPPPESAVDRWRGLYLYKERQKREVDRQGTLITYGAMVSRAKVLDVGNFDQSLRHSEDAELGKRLIRSGWDVVSDPSLLVLTAKSNTLSEVLERYWRWYAGKGEQVSFMHYLRDVIYSMRAMVWTDLRERDVLRAGISFVCPHYRFWRTVWRRIRA